EQIGCAPHHFPGGFVREGQQQDAVRGNALLQQKRDAIGECSCFARARARDDQGWTGRRGDGGVLLWVQFARVIDLQVDRRTKRLQHVVARHGRKLAPGRRGEKDFRTDAEDNRENGGCSTAALRGGGGGQLSAHLLDV